MEQNAIGKVTTRSVGTRYGVIMAVVYSLLKFEHCELSICLS